MTHEPINNGLLALRDRLAAASLRDKRERIAGAVLAGFAQNPGLFQERSITFDWGHVQTEMVQRAVSLADALIAELDKTEK